MDTCSRGKKKQCLDVRLLSASSRNIVSVAPRTNGSTTILLLQMPQNHARHVADAAMGTTIRPEDLQGDNVDDLEFQVVAESSEGVLSDAEKPTVVFTGTC